MSEESKDQVEIEKQIYQTLSKIDVSKYVKKKMGLDYLPWATAWGLAKSHYPDIEKKITEYPEYIPTNDGWKPTGRDVDYRLTPFGCEVEVKVTIEGITHSQNLYVMDQRGRAVKAKGLDMGQINKTQMRCLVKALSLWGLGLNLYAGEDLPSDESETAKLPERTKRTAQQSTQPKKRLTKKLYAARNVAKKFEVQYGGGKEKLVDICGWAKNGNKQAQLFLKDWTEKEAKNLARYNFIMENGLETQQKAEA